MTPDQADAITKYHSGFANISAFVLGAAALLGLLAFGMWWAGKDKPTRGVKK